MATLKGQVRTKYLIRLSFSAEGIVERPDVIGAIFGQTEGLFKTLDLRELQKVGRIGRIEVTIKSSKGKSEGVIEIPSGLDIVRTALIAAAIEMVERIGPCPAKIKVEEIIDVRETKKQRLIDRTVELLRQWRTHKTLTEEDLIKEIENRLKIGEIITYGPDKILCGPTALESEEVILVEGRADILNLLRHGISNTIATGGTNVPSSIADLVKDKKVTFFMDGDRGGELILKSLIQKNVKVDFVARAPPGREVEELTYEEIKEALENKIPFEKLKEEKKKELTVKVTPRIPNEIIEIASSIKNSGKAVVLDRQKNIVAELDVRDLIDVLDKSGDVSYLIMDGILSQRIVDILTAKKTKMVIVSKIGEVVKYPYDMEIIQFREARI